MKSEKINWLIGLIDGDGYDNDRKIEIYNSSLSILKEAVDILKKIGIAKEKINVDIYSSQPANVDVGKWSDALELPLNNFKVRLNTSPWKERKEKIRIRVHAKRLVLLLRSRKPSGIGYVRGLFDAEASVDIKGYVEFKQKAGLEGMKIVRAVHRILSKRKIKCTPIRIKNDMGRKNDAYFYVKDIQKFAKEVNFVDIDKKRKLEILLKVKDGKTKTVPNKLRMGEKQTLWDLMNETRLPYHTLRKCLKQ